MEANDPFVEKHLKKVHELQDKYRAIYLAQKTKPKISDDAIMGAIIGFGIGMFWALVGLLLL